MMRSDGHGYDDIVIGAGAAGCVVAARLSESGRRRVLLIEAGPDIPPQAIPEIVRDPYPRSSYETRFMWPKLRVIMKEARKDAPASPPWRYEQGRVFGGSGTLMGMMALRGTAGDFDDWANAGATGWAWADVLPFYKRLERDLDYDDEWHGQDGPVPIRRFPKSAWGPFSRAAAEEIEAQGYPFINDPNADFREGNIAIPYSNLPESRYSSAIAYLGAKERARRNLDIRTDTLAEVILVEGGRVCGVRVRSAVGVTVIQTRNVVVCAGSLHSPALLQRSGIGPAQTLRAAGVDVKVDLRGVGENLHNHPILYLACHLRQEGRHPPHKPAPSYNALRYSSGVADCPDLDMMMFVFNVTTWHALGRAIGAVAVALYKSLSRGSVSILSPAADEEPQVRMRLLSDPRDLARMTDGFQRVWRLMHRPGVRRLANEVFVPTDPETIRRLNRPTAANRLQTGMASMAMDSHSAIRRRLLGRVGADPAPFIDDRSALEDFVYRRTGSMFHPSGTCRMGSPGDPDAVLDARCRVFGVDGLRVADGSVMPSVTRGNTNIPIVMIAEKVSAMMIEDDA